MNVVGLDIGGANLKAANSDGTSVSRPFPIWQEHEQLANKLAELIEPLGAPDAFAVTMTAELADCFSTKAEGVGFILGKVEEIAKSRPVHVWQTGGEFVDLEVAADIPLLVAAANWHALATWLGRMVPTGPAILIDIGSSTTDVIPLLDGRPVAEGMTDVERLLHGELLYTGATRTPVFAMAHSVPLRGGHCPMAAELFATTLDVNLILGLLSEDESNIDTANGKPATIACAVDRLTHMLCCDRTELTDAEVRDMAEFLHDVQKQRIRGCIDKVRLRLPDPSTNLPHVLISGSGSFIAKAIVAEHKLLQDADTTVLNDMFDSSTATAACALAVAKLASERT